MHPASGENGMTDNNNPKFRDVIRRMRRIEGQARGITGMMEEGRYCVDILQQILALEAAARAARTKVLDIYTKHCIEQALASNNKTDQAEKVAELLALIERMAR